MSNLYTVQFTSPLGPIMAIADEKALYLLEFIERRGLKKEIEQLKRKTQAVIEEGWAEPLHSIEQEIAAYFKDGRTQFQTPIQMLGSPFQKRVWEELMKIPSGETRAYAEIAHEIGKPTAFRAVANANGANQLAILIPCHRVIHSNGGLGGYGGGIARKKWLLDHEGTCNV